MAGFMDQAMSPDIKSKRKLIEGIFGSKRNKPMDEAGDGDGDEGNSDQTLKGEWDGHLHVDDVDNGIIVSHTRHVAHKAASGGGKSNPSSSMGDSSYSDHKRVFAKDDHKGIAGHVLSIIKSPRKKR